MNQRNITFRLRIENNKYALICFRIIRTHKIQQHLYIGTIIQWLYSFRFKKNGSDVKDSTIRGDTNRFSSESLALQS